MLVFLHTIPINQDIVLFSLETSDKGFELAPVRNDVACRPEKNTFNRIFKTDPFVISMLDVLTLCTDGAKRSIPVFA